MWRDPVLLAKSCNAALLNLGLGFKQVRHRQQLMMLPKDQVIFDYISELKVLKIPYLKDNSAYIIQAFRTLSLLAMVRQLQRISMHDIMEIICDRG